MATIQATSRAGTGKGVARKLRMQGRLPGVVYGAGQPNLNLTFEKKEIMAIVAAMGSDLKTTPQTLEVDGTTKIAVLMRDLQRNPVTGWPEHLDFLRFDPNKRIEVRVPTHIIGEAEAPGVKMGGLLQHVTRDLLVHCLAGNIPHAFDVSVVGLTIGHSIHLSDLKLPAGVEVVGEPSMTIVTIVGKQAEETEGEESA